VINYCKTDNAFAQAKVVQSRRAPAVHADAFTMDGDDDDGDEDQDGDESSGDDSDDSAAQSDGEDEDDDAVSVDLQHLGSMALEMERRGPSTDDDDERCINGGYELQAAFDVFDGDGSGSLTADEVRHILTRGSKGMTVDDAKEFISEFDENGDCALDIDEFMEAVKSFAP
jgi:calmodulin